MRLTPDVIRELLLEVEEKGKVYFDIKIDPVKTYHLAHLIDAGLVRGASRKNHVSEISLAQSIDLTWKGHELIANIRNEDLWPKVKEKVKEAGGSVPFDMLGMIGKALLAQQLAKVGINLG